MSYTDDLILNSIKKSRGGIVGEPDALLKAINKAGLVQKEVQVRGKNGQVFTRKQWVKTGEDQPTQKPAGKQQDETDGTKPSKNQQSSHFTGKNMSELLSNLKNSGYEMDSADQSSPQDTVILYKDKQEFIATFNRYSNGGVEVLNIKSNKSSSGNDLSQKPAGGSGDGGDKDKTVKQSQWKTPSNKQDLVKLLQSGASREDIMAQAEKDDITWKKSDHPGINWMRCSMAITGTTTKGTKKDEVK